MGLFNIFSKKKKIKGDIGYYDLEEWWLNEFSEKERQYIQEKYQPLTIGESNNSLTSGEIISKNQSVIAFLSNLAGWFSTKNDLPIAIKILKKAEELSKNKIKNSSTKSNKEILDEHFLYSECIKDYYRNRDQSEYLIKAVNSCKQQIAIAKDALRAFKEEYEGDFIPSHTGYKQLAIILEKQFKYADAIELCNQAMNQGWNGDWEKRIERCKKKLEKHKASQG